MRCNFCPFKLGDHSPKFENEETKIENETK
jgi:hypothetical protein